MQRHDGFLKGFGISADDPSIVCSQDTGGDQAKGQTAMENCLQKAPDINVVYTINEPAALGAYTALKAKGREKDVLIVSVDGGCTGTQAVKDGKIAATSQQYPLKMAAEGVKAVVDVRQGRQEGRPATPTPASPLITDKAQTGVDVQGHRLRPGELLGLSRRRGRPHDLRSLRALEPAAGPRPP